MKRIIVIINKNNNKITVILIIMMMLLMIMITIIIVLVIWVRRRFSDTAIDCPSPAASVRCVLEQDTEFALLLSSQLTNECHMGHPRDGSFSVL